MEDHQLKTFVITASNGSTRRVQASSCADAAEVHARAAWLEGRAVGELVFAQTQVSIPRWFYHVLVREDAPGAKAQPFLVSVVTTALGLFDFLATPLACTGHATPESGTPLDPDRDDQTYQITFMDRIFEGKLYCDPQSRQEDPNIILRLGRLVAEHARDMWVERGGEDLPDRQIWRARHNERTYTFAVSGAFSPTCITFRAAEVGLRTEVFLRTVN